MSEPKVTLSASEHMLMESRIEELKEMISDLQGEVVELKKKAQMNIHNSAFNGLKTERDEYKKTLEFYADKDNWKIGGGTKEFPCYDKLTEHSIDTEWFEKFSHHVSGGLARLVLKKYESSSIIEENNLDYLENNDPKIYSVLINNRENQNIILSDDDFDKIIENLQRVSKPNEKLLNAARNHKQKLFTCTMEDYNKLLTAFNDLNTQNNFHCAKIRELERYKKDWQEIGGKANLAHLMNLVENETRIRQDYVERTIKIEEKLKVATEALQDFSDPTQEFYVLHYREVSWLKVATMKDIKHLSKHAELALSKIQSGEVKGGI